MIRPAALVPWKQPALPADFAYYTKRRARALKRCKYQLQTLPHLFVRVKNNPAERIVSKADGQVHLKLSAFGFVECSTTQSRPEQM